MGPEPGSGGEQGGEVVTVEIDDACQPGPHRLTGLVVAELIPPGAGPLPVPDGVRVEARQGGNVRDVEVGVDGLGAELGADGAGAQTNLGMLHCPLPPADQPGGDVTGVGCDRGARGRLERHRVRA